MNRWTVTLASLIGVALCVGHFFADMKETVSTVLGAVIALGGTWFFSSMDTEKSATYLAIRLVCTFDKYIEDCVAVVQDDGLCCGQRTQEGCLEPQVKDPGVPSFPSDVDWKSISSDLMYEILSFPADVASGKNDISSSPDFDEFFEERRFQYAQFGLKAYQLAQKLRKKYGIREKDYGDWNPVSILEKEFDAIKKARAKENLYLS